MKMSSLCPSENCFNDLIPSNPVKGSCGKMKEIDRVTLSLNKQNVHRNCGFTTTCFNEKQTEESVCTPQNVSSFTFTLDNPRVTWLKSSLWKFLQTFCEALIAVQALLTLKGNNNQSLLVLNENQSKYFCHIDFRLSFHISIDIRIGIISDVAFVIPYESI